MIRPTVALITLTALGLTGLRLRAPLQLSPRPLPPTVLVRVEKSLQVAGISCQPDADGTGLLVQPADLEVARQAAALEQYQSEMGPLALVQALEKLPRVQAASVRWLGDEAWVMLDAPAAAPVHGAITTVIQMFPRINRANVKVLDAQGRDLTRKRVRPDATRASYYRSSQDYLEQRVQDTFREAWQQEFDRTLGEYQVRLQVRVKLDARNMTVLYEGMTPQALRQAVLNITCDLAVVAQADQSAVRDLVQKLAKRHKIEDRLTLKASRWTGNQRPLPRLELERLRAALLPPRRPPENRWLGLFLLWPALTLWGIATTRLLRRHALGRRGAVA